jgi:YegS/Rv2252/BmrU family lipid kinase
MTVAVIINPISGIGGRPDAARRRAELAAAMLERRGVQAELFVTERPGHARELAAAAVAREATLVVAWGGDGTVNEVASALAFRDATLAIIPSGSGNGLARELRLPFDPAAAFAVALDGRERRMDAGELDGRMFFNIAGIGFDAHVAQQFAVSGLERRGWSRYVEITVRELFSFQPADHTVVADGVRVRTRPLMIAIANSRQYGNGAVIAPDALIDDGKLDVVVVEHRSPFATLLQIPKLFAGKVAQVPGVTILRTAEVEVESLGRVLYHVDGEPGIGTGSMKARVTQHALRVRVPRLVGG